MADKNKTVIKFHGVSYNVGDASGYRPVAEEVAGVYDLNFMEEVIEKEGLQLKAKELLHAVKAVISRGTALVAADGRPRSIEGVLTIYRQLLGSMTNASSAWDTTKNRCLVKARFNSECSKEITTDDATFTNVADVEEPKLNYVTYLGAQDAQNVIMDDKEIVAYGNNMQFVDTLGDTAEISYTDADGIEQTIQLTYKEGDIAHAVFEFPATLKAVEAGKKLAFQMVSRAGKATNDPTTCTKKDITWLGSSDPFVADWSYDGESMVWHFSENIPAVVTGANLGDIAKVTLSSGTHVVTLDSSKVTVVDEGTLKLKLDENNSDLPDNNWAGLATTAMFFDAAGEVVATLEGITARG